jgi:hypothetical protein
MSVSVSASVCPSRETVSLACVRRATALVSTLKLALVAPAGIVTPRGARTVGGPSAEIVTGTPPGRAGYRSVTVTVEVSPPTSVAGWSVRLDTACPRANASWLNSAPVASPRAVQRSAHISVASRRKKSSAATTGSGSTSAQTSSLRRLTLIPGPGTIIG